MGRGQRREMVERIGRERESGGEVEDDREGGEVGRGCRGRVWGVWGDMM